MATSPSAVIPPPPAGFDLEAPPARSAASVPPPPPPGFDFDAAPPPGPWKSGYAPPPPGFDLAAPPAPTPTQATIGFPTPISTSDAQRAPGVPSPPVPEGLKSDAQLDAERPWKIDAKTGERYQVPRLGQVPILDSPITGAQKIIHGVEQMAAPAQAAMYDASVAETGQRPTVPSMMTPELARQGAAGLSKTIGGAFEAATPLAVGMGITAPITTAATLLGGMAAQKGTAAGLQKLGVAPEYADLAGDIAGIAAGYGVAHAFMPPEVRALVETAARPDTDPGTNADRISKLTRLALHPDTPPNESAVAREMLRRMGVNIPQPSAGATVPETEQPTAPGSDINYANPESQGGPFAEPPGEPVHDTEYPNPELEQPMPPEPKEPVKPTPVKNVSPATPNPPTAAVPTQPEAPETIGIQMQQLGKFGEAPTGAQRKAVMFPGGQGMPPLETMAGLKITHDKFGNVYAYRPDLIEPSAIHSAARNNSLTEVLGGPMGMGAPDKSGMSGKPIAVVGRAPASVAAQTMAAQHLAGASLAGDRHDGDAMAAYLWKAAQLDPSVEQHWEFKSMAQTAQGLGFDYRDPKYNDGVTQKPTEAQTTVTDATNLPVTHAATAMVTPPGGSVSVESGAGVLAQRGGAGMGAAQPKDAVYVAPGDEGTAYDFRDAVDKDQQWHAPPVAPRLTAADPLNDLIESLPVTANPVEKPEEPVAAVSQKALPEAGLGQSSVAVTAPAKPTLADALESVRRGERELTIDVRGWPRPKVAELEGLATSKGLHVSGDGKHVLVRPATAVTEPPSPVTGQMLRSPEQITHDIQNLKPIEGETPAQMLVRGKQLLGEYGQALGIQNRLNAQQIRDRIQAADARLQQAKIDAESHRFETVKKFSEDADRMDAESSQRLANTAAKTIADMGAIVDAAKARIKAAVAAAPDEEHQYGANLPFKAKDRIKWNRPSDGLPQEGTITRSTSRMYEVELDGHGGSLLVPNTVSEAWAVQRAPSPPKPLTAREATKASKELHIYVSGYDLKTVEGRKRLTAAIHEARIAPDPDHQQRVIDDLRSSLASAIEKRDRLTRESESARSPEQKNAILRVAKEWGDQADKLSKEVVKTGKNETSNPANTSPAAATGGGVPTPAPGAVPQGDGLNAVRGPIGDRGATANAGGVEPVARGEGDGARGVTGGVTRLYRGQSGQYGPSVHSSNAGRWFTASKDEAAKYGDVRHVDIPTTKYRELLQDEADAIRRGESPYSHLSPRDSVLLPIEYANRAAASPTGTTTTAPIRRVTGSADIPLSQAGKEQVAKEVANKAPEPFDLIVAAPNHRSTQTAAMFHGANRITDKAFDGWARGELEGQNADDVNDHISALIKNPDTVPPGVSPASGKPGVTYRKFTMPMLQKVASAFNTTVGGKRTLIVTSGGNLQAIDAWLKAGQPNDYKLDYPGLAEEPYASVTGKLFKLTGKGLVEVTSNKEPGLYASEHGSTEWNSKGGAKAADIKPQPERDKRFDAVRISPALAARALAAGAKEFGLAGDTKTVAGRKNLANALAVLADAKKFGGGVSAADSAVLTEAQAKALLDRKHKLWEEIYDAAEKLGKGGMPVNRYGSPVPANDLEKAVQPIQARYDALKNEREGVERAQRNKEVGKAADKAAFDRATTVRPENPTPADIDARKNEDIPQGYRISKYANGNRLLQQAGKPGVVQSFDTREWQWADEYTGPATKAAERFDEYAKRAITQSDLDTETSYIHGAWATARGEGNTEVEAAPEPPKYERPVGETEQMFMARNAGKKPHEMSLADWHRFMAYEYLADGERRARLIAAGLGTEAQRTAYHAKAVEDANKAAIPPTPSAEGFDAATKELAGIEKNPEYAKDTQEGMRLRDRAIELREHEVDFHRPAAVARAQADIDREKGNIGTGPLPKEAEPKFQQLLSDGLADRQKEAMLTADLAAVKETYNILARDDGHYQGTRVGQREAVINRKTEVIGRGKSKTTQTTYNAMVTDPRRPPLQQSFRDAKDAAAWATDRLYSLGMRQDDWNNYSGGGNGPTARLIRTGKLLENSQSGLVAADAAAKAIGKPELAHEIYSQAFEGGWKGSDGTDTLKSIAGRYADRLPRNEIPLTEFGGSSNRGDSVKQTLVSTSEPKKGYEPWASQVEKYEREANGIKQALEGVRKRISIAEFLNGGVTPRIAESAKIFDEYEQNTAKNLAFVKDAAKTETVKEVSDLKEPAKAAAEAYAKYGTAAFTPEYYRAGGGTGQGALDRYMRLKDIKGYDAALAHFGIEKQAPPARITIPETGKDKLDKGEKESLEKADLVTGNVPFVSQGTIEKLRARGWVTDSLTDLGKAAAWSYRMDKIASEAGLPMSKYEPKPGAVAEGMPESRFGSGSNAWNLYKGDVWHTNGHGVWKGEYPKQWIARDINNPGPDITRVIPQEKGESIEPIGFTKIDDNSGKPIRFIYFNNGKSMSGLYFDYTNRRYGPGVTWSQGKGKNDAFQARDTQGNLVGVVMGTRSEVPESLINRINAAAEQPTPTTPAPPTYMGSGLGAIQPHLEEAGKAAAQYAREEMYPKVAKAISGTRDAVNALVNLFDPRRGVPTKTLDEIYRLRGGQESGSFLLASKLNKWGKQLSKLPQEEQIKWWDRRKTGKPQLDANGNPDPGLQALADFSQRLSDGMYIELKKFNPSLPYLENHQRVLWKVIPGSPEAQARMDKQGFKGVFRRPLQGSKGSLKQHTLTDMSEGLEQGGVPYSYDPIKMIQADYADTMKYITAQKLWAKFGKDGVRKFVPFSGKPKPEGYEYLDDGIANVYFPVKEGLVNAGRWALEQNAARILKSMLGRDYLREVYGDTPISQLTGNLGSALLTIKHLTTGVELSWSPFHAVFEAIEAAASQIGVGLREGYNLGVRGGNPRMIAKGLKTIAGAPFAPYTAARHGSMGKQAYGNFEEFSKTVEGRKWLAENPGVRENLPWFFLGGGKMTMPEQFRIGAENSLEHYWKSARAGNKSHYFGTLARAPMGIQRQVMAPLFEKYIPNLKIGFFLKEFALAKQEYADRLASGEMTLGKLARQVVDGVENRFGEMNFDNLYWNRTFKTALQIMFRSITWKWGNLRAEMSAVGGQAKELSRAFRGVKQPIIGPDGKEQGYKYIREGKLPLLHPSMGWALGVGMAAAMIGTIIHWYSTGKAPESRKDILHPVIDAKNGMRVNVRTYALDLEHQIHDPKGYITSSLSGELGRAAEVARNQNYDREEVYNVDDPWYRKLLDSTLHFIPIPFVGSNIMRAGAEGGNTASKVAAFMGFGKAPRYIEQSNAERLASEYGQNHREVGSRTKFEAERARARYAIENAYRHGLDPKTEIDDALSNGLLDQKAVNQAQSNARMSPLKASIRGLTIPEALRVYDAATEAERKEINKDVHNKVFAASKHEPGLFGKADDETRSLAKKYFSVTPPVPAPRGWFGQQPHPLGNPSPF